MPNTFRAQPGIAFAIPGMFSTGGRAALDRKHWRRTLDNHTGAALDCREPSCGARSRKSATRGASAVRIAAPTVLSHPGMPSLRSKARPTPRGWSAALYPRAEFLVGSITWERSSSYWTVYSVTSVVAASTIIDVFFPPAADRDAAAAGYCADAPRRRSAAPEASPTPRPWASAPPPV